MARRASARGTRLWRDALAAQQRWALRFWPTLEGQERLQDIERGNAVECSSASLFMGLTQLGAPEAEQFTHLRLGRAAYFRLGADDVLTEIPHGERAL